MGLDLLNEFSRPGSSPSSEGNGASELGRETEIASNIYRLPRKKGRRAGLEATHLKPTVGTCAIFELSSIRRLRPFGSIVAVDNRGPGSTRDAWRRWELTPVLLLINFGSALIEAEEDV